MKKIFDPSGSLDGFPMGLIEIPFNHDLGPECRQSIDLDEVLPIIVSLQAELPTKVKVFFAPAEDEEIMKIFIICVNDPPTRKYDLAIEAVFRKNNFERTY